MQERRRGEHGMDERGEHDRLSRYCCTYTPSRYQAFSESILVS